MSPQETPQFTEWAFDAAAAEAEAESWRGTPHANRMAKKGVGVDCIHLVCALLTAGGASPAFTMPPYDQRLGLGADENVMETLLLTCWNAAPIDPARKPPDGAIVIFQAGRQSNHCAMMLGGKIWHAVARQRVRADDWSTWGDRMQAALIITAPGFRRNPETLTKEEIEHGRPR